MPNYLTLAEPSASRQHDIEAQLADLERQGGSMARMAHICAGALLLVFSAGSLISLSYAALQTLIATWERGGGVDIPNAINTAVNPLLVLAMDVAMLYAASVMRVLTAARAPKEETRVHVWIMAGASMLESATYLYMTWQFDRPQNGWLWIIAVGRAVAAPLFAVYLSMARPLPVAPRDVAYQAALASGKGVIRDVTVLANDPAAPLHRKVRIYTASSRMTARDAEQFAGIIEAVSEGGDEREPTTPAPAVPLAARTDEAVHFRPIGEWEPMEREVQARIPARTGQPIAEPLSLPRSAYREEAPEPGAEDDALAALVDRADAMRSNVRRPSPARAQAMDLVAPAKRQPAPRRGDVGMSQQARLELTAQRKKAARRALADDPSLGVRDLARKVAIATKHRISESTAATLLAELRHERRAPAHVTAQAERSPAEPFRGGQLARGEEAEA